MMYKFNDGSPIYPVGDIEAFRTENEKLRAENEALRKLYEKWVSTEIKLPEDCQPVYAKRLVRFKKYKPSSQQSKQGIQGRWQEWNGYGWLNCEQPVAWQAAKE